MTPRSEDATTGEPWEPWHERLRIRWELGCYRLCKRLTHDRHRWGKVAHDDLFGATRQCRWCGIHEMVPKTEGTTTATIWIGDSNAH